MRKALASIVCVAGLLGPGAAALAANPAPAAPGQKAATQTPPPAKNPDEAARIDAAEARYRAWSQREHAQDDAVFAKEKAKIEDKYKGYVRPKHHKKAAGPQAPAKGD